MEKYLNGMIPQKKSKVDEAKETVKPSKYDKSKRKEEAAKKQLLRTTVKRVLKKLKLLSKSQWQRNLQQKQKQVEKLQKRKDPLLSLLRSLQLVEVVLLAQGSQ